ncbi:STAS domain-containing protein [Streptomyces sp. NPDC048252]|uniref:STAS domain-containing protein n=1 Tax=Streptomyces sp. NPDC048252 TaxID=3154612 RepID=UPI00341A5C59
MLRPQLTVHRHVRRNRALITLSGEVDLDSAPLLCASLERCLRDGIHTVDVDLTSVRFCDCSGLNTFLRAAQQATVAGGALRLHHPPPTLARMLELTGCGFLLLGPPAGPLPSPPRGRSCRAHPRPAAPAGPTGACALGRCAMTVGPRQRQCRKPEGGGPPAVVPVRSRRSPVRAGSWWLVLDGSSPRGMRQLTVPGRAFAPAGLLIRPHPRNRVLAPPAQEGRSTGHQASLDATLADRADRSTSAALPFPGWLYLGKLHSPARPTSLRAPAVPLGEGTTARLKGLVTAPGGGGPSGF